jgi:dihydroneopterin aldolase
MMGSDKPYPMSGSPKTDYNCTMPRKTTRIVLEGLSQRIHCGVSEQERSHPQTLLLDLELEFPFPADDQIEATMDYSIIPERLDKRLSKDSFCLIETIAQTVAQDLLQTFPQLNQVAVRVHKPSAPLGIPFADLFAEVRLARGPDRSR